MNVAIDVRDDNERTSLATDIKREKWRHREMEKENEVER